MRTIKDAFVFKVLDISTGHMTEVDNHTLSENDGTMSAYDLDGYGWLVYVGEIDENWDEMSEEFRDVLRHARTLDCDYVRWDRDGREYAELPHFDW